MGDIERWGSVAGRVIASGREKCYREGQRLRNCGGKERVRE